MKLTGLRRLWLRLRLRLAPGPLLYVGGSERLPPPLEREEEAECIERLLNGDETARKTLVEHNLRLVVYIARRFENTSLGLEDLVSIGTIGLIKAVETFRLDRNIKLATYASRCIESEILMVLRKLSREKSEVSLDEPLNTDWDGNELLLSDILGTDGEEVSRALEEEGEVRQLRCLLDQLPSREQEIIRLRFGLGGGTEYTQKEVAKLLGISQSYISRLEKRILGRLRQELLRVMG